MNAASSGQPARGDDGSAPAARGVVAGRLLEAHHDRIVVGICTLFLCDGQACSHPVGTPVEVVYTERNGQRHVDRITAIHARP
jgi:hypothetical protein